MTTVCFTGAGKRFSTQTFTRDEWHALANGHRLSVTDKVQRYNTDILVASRSDTTKADAARLLGVQVMTYHEFEVYLEEVATRIGSGSNSSSTTVYSPTGEALTYPSRATVAPVGPPPRALSIQAGARGTYAVVFDNGSRTTFPNYDAARVNYDLTRRATAPASPRAPERHPITNVPSSRPYGIMHYACNNRTFSARSSAESYRFALIVEEDRDAARTAVPTRSLADEREAAGQCIPHGFALNECQACRANAAAEEGRKAQARAAKIAAEEERAAKRAEAQRIEDAKLAPIGALKGRRRMNLDGED